MYYYLQQLANLPELEDIVDSTFPYLLLIVPLTFVFARNFVFNYPDLFDGPELAEILLEFIFRVGLIADDKQP